MDAMRCVTHLACIRIRNLGYYCVLAIICVAYGSQVWFSHLFCFSHISRHARICRCSGRGGGTQHKPIQRNTTTPRRRFAYHCNQTAPFTKPPSRGEATVLQKRQFSNATVLQKRRFSKATILQSDTSPKRQFSKFLEN